jgi:type I restriction enzyme S subunit
MSEIGSKWQMTEVKNLADHITVGFVGSMSDLFVENGVPLLRGQNIHEYALDLKNLKYISQETHRKWKKSALMPGDVAIVRVGYPGTACVIPDGIGDLNAASLVIVRPDRTKLDSNFLCYVINSPWGKAQVSGRLVGSAQQVFNTQTAAELKIPHPTLPVQQRIAGILSAYDELIENSQQRIKILESMARALYREWFVYFRYPGHESVPLVPSVLGDIPQGWEIQELRDLFDFVGGSQPPKNEHVYEERAGYVRFIQNRDYGSSNHLTYIADSPRNKFCDPLDIMVDKYGEPGRTRFGLAGAYNVALAKILPHEVLYREWLRGLISEPEFNTYLAGASMAATRASLNSSHFILPVAVPTAGVAKSFAAHVEPLLQLLLSHRETIANLRATRDLLLPRLLSGQIEVEALAS